MSPILNIYKPVKIHDDVFYSRLIFKEDDIIFQLKKNKLSLDKNNNKALIELDSKTKKDITWIGEEVVKETSKNSETWFGKNITIEDCKSLYRDCITGDDKLKCFYDENSYFYESKNNFIEHSNLLDEMLGIAIIKCPVIIFTKTAFYLRWEISQFKIKKTNEEKIQLTEYSIRDLEEHNLSIDDFNIENKLKDKLKDISLF
tara:strand:- start:8740 stop:9345 length:606 start_codon:yes stop_codon:yes gene_type:complete